MKIAIPEHRRRELALKWLHDNYGGAKAKEDFTVIWSKYRKKGRIIFYYNSTHHNLNLTPNFNVLFLGSMFGFGAVDIERLLKYWFIQEYGYGVDNINMQLPEVSISLPIYLFRNGIK